MNLTKPVISTQHSSHLRCCFKRIHTKPSLLQSIQDLISLYSTGVYELVRQLVFASPHPILTSATYERHLHELQRQNLIVIITGGTSGIGRSLLELLRKVALHVVLLAHPRHELSTIADHQILIDFASRDAIEFAANALLQHLRTLPKNPVILFHCAAVYNPHESTIYYPESSTVAETTSQINCIMPTLFLYQVRHAVDVTVLIGSSAQNCAHVFDKTTCPICIATTSYAAYPMSKLVMLANADAWAHTWGKRVIAIHPGIVATPLYDGEPGIMGMFLRAVVNTFAWTPHQSAVRVLGILCLTKVWSDTAEQPPKIDHDDHICHRLPLYWDTVGMCPAALPTQIKSSSDRSAVAQWTYAHLDLAWSTPSSSTHRTRVDKTRTHAGTDATT